MAMISIVKTSDVFGAERWDAESYRADLLRLESAVRMQDSIGTVARVIHPAEIQRSYTDESGVPFILAANIRAILPNLNATPFIPRMVANNLPMNRLEPGDVLVTRTGAHYGTACVYLGASGAFYTSGEGLIVRPQPGIDGAYLGVFLGCTYGLQLCQKAVYGSGQPHIGPPYLRKLPVLRLGKQEAIVATLAREAWGYRSDALPFYKNAQTEMLNAIGWDTFVKPKSALWHIVNFKDVAAADRFDTTFFSPRARGLYRLLSRDRHTIHDVARLANRRFTPEAGIPIEYIEISDVDDIGRFTSATVQGEDAPDRAKWLVEKNDVLTSTVRPIRRLTGVVSDQQVGFVCSNGFGVLCPRAIEPEVLLVYLRLPPVCELLDIYCRGSMYPAYAATDLPQIPIAIPSKDVRKRIVDMVQAAWKAQAGANRKLEQARNIIENEIRKRLA